MFNNYIHGNNFLRALITDTVPYETPIIFSNEGLYFNLLVKFKPELQKFINPIMYSTDCYTIPYNFSIRQGKDKIRTLSLLHPLSQVKIVDFYEKYDQTICYFSSNPKISIRRPVKASGSYYTRNRNQERNKYREDGVESTSDDFFTKYNVSYFAYAGYDRIHKFYDSLEFSSLERQFRFLKKADVSKCFDSIYTHSISWATKDKIVVKENVNIKTTFGQKFDSLMQQSNYNETNGIPIGAEVSRIFSEIIFQSIDQDATATISRTTNYEFGVDYKIKRYVDDIFFFAKSNSIIETIFAIYSESLEKYNLSINESKTVLLERPFVTKKTRIVNAIYSEIESFTDEMYRFVSLNGKTLDVKTSDKVVGVINKNKAVILHKIYRPQKFVNSFIRRIKTICEEVETGYDDISPYIISTVNNKIKRLVTLLNGVDISEDVDLTIYKLFRVLLGVAFYFYDVSPSVGSSYKLAQACIISVDYMEKEVYAFRSAISEFIYENIFSITESNLHLSDCDRKKVVPLEIVNLALISAHLGQDYMFDDEMLRKIFIKEGGELGYFEIISLLFYCKNNNSFSSIRRDVEKEIVKRLTKDSSYMTTRSGHFMTSENTHLMLDVMSCPYINDDIKEKIIKKVSQFAHFTFTSAEIKTVITQMNSTFWFVDWSQINLLNTLLKKELKTAY